MRRSRLLFAWQITLAGLMFLSALGSAQAKDAASEFPVLTAGHPSPTMAWDDKTGRWTTAWPGGLGVVVERAGFSLQVDGKEVPVNGATTRHQPVTDALGTGMGVRQEVDGPVHVVREVCNHGPQLITVSAWITNTSERDVSLGTVRLIEVNATNAGRWAIGSKNVAPAVVYVRGLSQMECEPAWERPQQGKSERTYGGTTLLGFAGKSPRAGLVIGFLASLEGRPDVSATYRLGEGGTVLTAQVQLFGRKLAPGKSIELGPVYVGADADPYVALEDYADAAARFAGRPVRKGGSSLWCSWYAHRMAMTEDLVLANAEVAARHFKPLGMDVIQIDHGWQRGDITGDWFANDRFSHGLKWLASELKQRYGFKLGVWIAPTDVADTSELYKQHTDWMLKDATGKPKVNWKWYWKPNPNCYELDASNPAAAKWIEDTFARLSGNGVEYFKIDFLAACGGEHFVQHDPYVTRGWSVLRQAMESIRRGAGDKAWIRYCQAAPLLAAGLADSAYGGEDTLDAGVPDRIDVLRNNARYLAAGYWLNDRLYHRELCDMSVRMQADVDEVRLRLAMMTLAGCSIAFSDEFQYLPASRIAMMQQCLPPGSPAMRPLDLFDRPIPSIWRVHCKKAADEWDVVGLFNWEDQPAERVVRFADLGLPATAEVAALEFWESAWLGKHRQSFTMTLAPRTCRIVVLHRLADTPQVIGTDMHLLSGWHELSEVEWDAKALVLRGKCRRAAGLAGRVFIHVPAGYQPRFDFPLNAQSATLTHVCDQVWAKEIQFTDAECAWSAPFTKTK